MSVAIDTVAVLPYIGNGTANVFPITFPTFEPETIEGQVGDADGIVNDLAIDVDFSLASVGLPNTNGSFTLLNAGQPWLTAGGKLKTGYTLYVKFKATGYQPMKGRDWGAFAPERIERTLDRFAMSILAVKNLAGQALGLQLGENASGTLPPLAGNALNILQVNATETGFEYGISSDTIIQAKIDAETAKADAVTAKNQSVAAKDAAVAAKDAALASQTAAANSATSSANSAVASQAAAVGAAASQAAATQSVTDANIAKNGAITAQGLAEDARDAAIAAAADTAVVEGFRNEAEIFRDEAEDARDDSITAKNASESARDDAILAANDAETAMTSAETAMGLAEIYKDEAEESADDSEIFANLSLYAHKMTISFADSPFQIDDDAHENTLIMVDDAGGNVVINMCAISDTADQSAWKVGFMKKAATGNKFTVNRHGTDTIGGVNFIDVTDPGLGLLTYANSPTNWAAKYFVSVIATDSFVISGSGLNFGDPGLDGTWRIRQDVATLKFEQRQLGVWVEADILNPPAP